MTRHDPYAPYTDETHRMIALLKDGVAAFIDRVFFLIAPHLSLPETIRRAHVRALLPNLKRLESLSRHALLAAARTLIETGLVLPIRPRLKRDDETPKSTAKRTSQASEPKAEPELEDLTKLETFRYFDSAETPRTTQTARAIPARPKDVNRGPWVWRLGEPDVPRPTSAEPTVPADAYLTRLHALENVALHFDAHAERLAKILQRREASGEVVPPLKPQTSTRRASSRSPLPHTILDEDILQTLIALGTAATSSAPLTDSS